MKYLKPNIDHEWMEALRYREFEKMGKDSWKDIASNDYDITNYNKIKDVLKNVDLDFDTLEDEKKERFNKAFKKGKVEIPMVGFTYYSFEIRYVFQISLGRYGLFWYFVFIT